MIHIDKYLILISLSISAILWVYAMPFNNYLRRLLIYRYSHLTLAEKVKARIKPFDCETCLTFWASLIYLYSVNFLLSDWHLIPINMYLCMVFVRIIKA